MKRLTRYQAWLVLLASTGINFNLLPHPAHAAPEKAIAPADANPTDLAEQTPPPLIAQATTAADSALAEGIGLVRQGNIDAAIAAFERSVALDPASAAAYYNLGLAQRQNNQIQAAATAFWQVTQADSTFALA
ncbi:MAG: tetratricopeptide repeat protein, partial [Phormidesmis sp.]